MLSKVCSNNIMRQPNLGLVVAFVPSIISCYTAPINQRRFSPRFSNFLLSKERKGMSRPSSSFFLSSSTSVSKYWDKELRSKIKTSTTVKVSREARIISLSDPKDDANKALYFGQLPDGAKLLAVESLYENFDINLLKQQKPNVLFVSHPKVYIFSIFISLSFYLKVLPF